MTHIDPAQLADGWLARLVWRSVWRLSAFVGVVPARRLATLMMRAEARTARGWAKGVFRVAAPHVAARAPRIEKPPQEWWTTRPVVRTNRLGLRLRLDLRDNLQRVLYCTGTYEPQVIAQLRRALGRGSVFVDVGAHIGVHSLVAAQHLRQLGGGLVYAFEPTPDSAARIRQAAAHSGLDITVIERALGAASGQVDLFASDAYSEADTGLRSEHGVGPHLGSFPMVSFDEWAAEVGLDRLDAVKIDVEGAEASVIEGMENSLRDLRPGLLVVETKHNTAGSAALPQHLAALGYRRVGSALFGNDIFADGTVPELPDGWDDVRR